MAASVCPQTIGGTSLNNVEHPDAVEKMQLFRSICSEVSEDNHIENVATVIEEPLARGSIFGNNYVHYEEIVEARQTNTTKYGDQGEQDTECLPYPLGNNGTPVNLCKVPLLQQQQCILDELKPGLPEYDNIVEEFSRVNIKVTRIEKLQNMRLLNRVKAEQEDIKKDRGTDSNPNIRYLYHGTSLDKKIICEEGLDHSSSKLGNRGRLFSFSDKPQKCIHYSGHTNRPEETMILKCRVILGDSEGSLENLTEYVVHENVWVIVEYLISFEVDEATTRLIAAAANHEVVQNEHAAKGGIGKGWKPKLILSGIFAVALVIIIAFGRRDSTTYCVNVTMPLGSTAYGVNGTVPLGFTPRGVTTAETPCIKIRIGGIYVADEKEYFAGCWLKIPDSKDSTGDFKKIQRILVGVKLYLVFSVIMSMHFLTDIIPILYIVRFFPIRVAF